MTLSEWAYMLVGPLGLLRSIDAKIPFLLKLYVFLHVIGLGRLVDWLFWKFKVEFYTKCPHQPIKTLHVEKWVKGKLIYKIHVGLCKKCSFG